MNNVEVAITRIHRVEDVGNYVIVDIDTGVRGNSKENQLYVFSYHNWVQICNNDHMFFDCDGTHVNTYTEAFNLINKLNKTNVVISCDVHMKTSNQFTNASYGGKLNVFRYPGYVALIAADNINSDYPASTEIAIGIEDIDKLIAKLQSVKNKSLEN